MPIHKKIICSHGISNILENMRKSMPKKLLKSKVTAYQAKVLCRYTALQCPLPFSCPANWRTDKGPKWLLKILFSEPTKIQYLLKHIKL